MNLVADGKLAIPSLPKTYFGPQSPVNILDDTVPTPIDTPGLTRGGSPSSSDYGENVRPVSQDNRLHNLTHSNRANRTLHKVSQSSAWRAAWQAQTIPPESSGTS